MSTMAVKEKQSHGWKEHRLSENLPKARKKGTRHQETLRRTEALRRWAGRRACAKGRVPTLDKESGR